MARLPFDPAKMARAPGTEAPPDDRPLSVTELASLIDGALRRHLAQRLRVIGEISGFAERTHWYFKLKDEQSVIDCVMFASIARRLRFTPVSGQKVLLSGRVEYYGRQGRTQFYAERMEPVGAGELDLRFRALCEELRKLGWFDPERKRRLPTFPRRVGVVTSKTGAALQDVLATMRNRCPAVEVAVVDVRVQGEGAPGEIARALAWLSDHHQRLGIQAIIVTRGGGSPEDLWAFNERVVAEAILNCPVPVVAAVGHETDLTIAELVADERGATPTQAAVRLTPDRAALAEELDQLRRALSAVTARRLERSRDGLGHADGRLLHAGQRRVARQQVRIERLAGRLARLRPEAVYAARRGESRELSQRLRRAISGRLHAIDLHELRHDLVRAWHAASARRTQRLNALERELAVAGPPSVLARGYSVTTTPSGVVVRSTSDVKPGLIVSTRVADGAFRSVVSGSDGVPPAAPLPTLPPLPRAPAIRVGPARRRRRAPLGSPGGSRGGSQMDLF